jgi:ABC-type glycerol-3-phosphate transport system permease component
MSIILQTERKSFKSRLVIAAIYLLLGLGGITMVYPFLITVSSSLTGNFEYNRFLPCPRSLYERADRFVRSLENYFGVSGPAPMVFKDKPASWASWTSVGDNPRLISVFAAPYLAVEGNPPELAKWRLIAADYALFSIDYDMRDTTCWYDTRDLAGFLKGKYTGICLEKNPGAAGLSSSKLTSLALAELRAEWGVPYASFFDVRLEDEKWYPMGHASWDYPDTAKAKTYLEFKDAYRRMAFRPGAEAQWKSFAKSRGVSVGSKEPWPVTRNNPNWQIFKEFVAEKCPASPTMPFQMKAEWIRFLNRQDAKDILGFDDKSEFRVADYNRLFGTGYKYLEDIPFPVPEISPEKLRKLWDCFVSKYYPRRLMAIRVTPELQSRYQDSLLKAYRTIDNYNKLAGTKAGSFSEIALKAYENSAQWRNFVGALTPGEMELRSAEASYQKFLLVKYGSVAEINRVYRWNLNSIEEAELPLAQAMTVTFFNNEWRYFLNDIAKNYFAVYEYMVVRGDAFLNTVIYIAICIVLSLTINPLSAYALSRFKLKWGEQILLFLLATMAFPGAVTAIPSFLLLRDLQLLNTFYALFLPGLANGMSIFIMKCFFDGLPRELYEAATIDGASEVQIFLHISLPMVTPILAISALNAFIGAYNSWEWALIVCQKETYWTIAVWLYQLSQTLQDQPFVIMAGFVAASIPTALVFIFCQKIILRGIVIPSMK